MQCRDAQEALGAVIDGEVSAIDEAAREHVSKCPLCAQRSEEYRDIGAKLRAVAHQTPAARTGGQSSCTPCCRGIASSR